MKTSSLKPDTEYATCSGALVVPVEPIHANWAKVALKKGEKIKDVSKQVESGTVPKTGTDPWRQCHRDSTGRKVKVDPIIGRRGVLMTCYEVDRDGRRISDTAKQIIVEPSDIKGTWKQYLALYAHVVRDRVDTETRKLETEKRMAAIQQALDDAFPGLRVTADRYTYRRPHVSITITRDGSDSMDDLQELAEELGARVDSV